MRFAYSLVFAACLFGLAPALRAQPAAATTTIPRLVRFASSFHAQAPQPPAAGLLSATFSVYREQEGGAPLWSETQNVELDSQGNYSVLLGSTTNGGLPAELFAPAEPRWLAVRFHVPGELETRRILLASVPYALKAADADTLGGIPASAFMLAAPVQPSAETQAAAAPANSAGKFRTLATSGTPNYLGKFAGNGTDLTTSSVYDTGSAVSVGGTANLGALTLIGNVPSGDAPGMALYNQGGGAGASVSLDLYNTQYNSNIPQAKVKAIDDGAYSDHLTFWTKVPGGPGNPVSERVRITSAGNLGIGTTTPAARLEVNGNAQVDGNLTVNGSILGASGPVFQASSATNLAAGAGAMPSSTGGQDTAVGANALHATTSGSFNSAFGYGALQVDSSGGLNTAIGNAALLSNTTGSNNTAVGTDALQNNTTASGNTAVGILALYANTTGSNNTAVGTNALYANTQANNTAVGENALFNNTTGSQNTAVGTTALQTNTTSSFNSAFGFGALQANTGGGLNTALGNAALFKNTNGANNTAVGTDALLSNTTGGSNTGVGELALYSNTTGVDNTAVGAQALTSTTGASNTAVGYQAGTNLGATSYNTALGAFALLNTTTAVNDTAVGMYAGQNSNGNDNTAIGYNALANATGFNNTAIGSGAGSAITSANNTITIGTAGTNVTGAITIGDSNYSQITLGANGPVTINGSSVTANGAVYIPGLANYCCGDTQVFTQAGTGLLVVHVSSRRYKEDIQDMGEASTGLFRLRPVTYRYKKPYADGSKPLDYGLIAEEVAEVYPGLVVKNKDGQIETLHYDKLTPMLLNELQKQHRLVEQQNARIHALENRLAALEALLAGKSSATPTVDR